MFSHIENTFNMKFLSYFEDTYNGTTRPETPIYFHRILHSNVAVFEYDMCDIVYSRLFRCML